MKTNNNFDTIGLIISLILSDSFTASVKSLAEACDLPVQQMRKYLSVIFNNKNLLTHLSPTPGADDENEEDDFEEIANDFLSKIASGKADADPIYLVDMHDFIDDYLLLPITSIEAGYVSNVYPTLLQNQRANLFETKDLVDSVPKNILDKQKNRLVLMLFQTPGIPV